MEALVPHPPVVSLGSDLLDPTDLLPVSFGFAVEFYATRSGSHSTGVDVLGDKAAAPTRPVRLSFATWHGLSASHVDIMLGERLELHAALFAGIQAITVGGMANKPTGMWKSGKHSTLPTSPHPRQWRLSELTDSYDKLPLHRFKRACRPLAIAGISPHAKERPEKVCVVLFDTNMPPKQYRRSVVEISRSATSQAPEL